MLLEAANLNMPSSFIIKTRRPMSRDKLKRMAAKIIRESYGQRMSNCIVEELDIGRLPERVSRFTKAYLYLKRAFGHMPEGWKGWRRINVIVTTKELKPLIDDIAFGFESVRDQEIKASKREYNKEINDALEKYNKEIYDAFNKYLKDLRSDYFIINKLIENDYSYAKLLNKLREKHVIEELENTNLRKSILLSSSLTELRKKHEKLYDRLKDLEKMAYETYDNVTLKNEPEEETANPYFTDIVRRSYNNVVAKVKGVPRTETPIRYHTAPPMCNPIEDAVYKMRSHLKNTMDDIVYLIDLREYAIKSNMQKLIKK
jgi:hypothetical protein